MEDDASIIAPDPRRMLTDPRRFFLFFSCILNSVGGEHTQTISRGTCIFCLPTSFLSSRSIVRSPLSLIFPGGCSLGQIVGWLVNNLHLCTCVVLARSDFMLIEFNWSQ